VTIITATLITVAAMESRIMNRENDCCSLSAMRFAMKKGRFNMANLKSCARYQPLIPEKRL